MKNFLSTIAGAVALAFTCGSAFAATGFATQNGGTTGGQGGSVVRATTGTEIHQAICNRANDNTPLIIEVEGTITPGNTQKASGSCNTADGVIELKEIQNITIIGVGSGALLDEIGVHIRNSSNIILRNLHIRDVKKSGGTTSNGGDAIGMESNVSNVWVDHVTLEAFGGESEGYDGLFDMKADTTYVTLSYSVLMNSGRGGLVGSSTGDLNNGPVTYHHNHYINIDSRVPLLRGGTAHIYNNHYDGINKSGINARRGGKAKVDNNYFENAKDPIGTFYVDAMGYWDVSGNIFDNVTWTEDGSSNHPAGPDVQSTTSISIPYSYSLDDASCVPGIVAATAGAYTNMAVSDGSCEVTIPDPAPTAVPTAEPPVDPTSEPTSEPGAPAGDEVLNITESGTSSDFFDISGNLSSSKGTVNYNGLTLTEALKIESSTSITFTSASDAELVLVFNEGESGDIKINGTSNTVSNGVLSVELSAGSHSISKDDSMNLYYISLAYEGGAAPTLEPTLEPTAGPTAQPSAEPTVEPTSVPEITLSWQEGDSGFCSVDGNIENDHSGYTGSGYANTTNASGTAVKYSVVVDADGDYSAVVTYANGGSSARDGVFTINGNNTETLGLGVTGAWDSYTDSTAVTLQLTAGYNEVNLVATGGSGLANIDKLELTGYGLAQGDCSGAVTPTAEPSAVPTAQPTAVPTAEPTAVPTAQPTSEPGAPSGEVLNITESGTSSDFFDISGNLSSSKGTVNYNGLTLTQALKIESSTSITFTSGANAELVLVFNEGEGGDIKIDGTSYAVSSGVLSVALSAGSHSISKADSMNLYYISLSHEGTTVPTGEPTAPPSTEPTGEPTGEPTPVPTLPPVSGDLSADCIALATDDSVNWYDTSLQTDQEIIECLSQSLGRAVGYGQNALGGYNPAGGSNLVVITNDNAEDQILAAISSAEHNWIVFDKNDFASETYVMMYRPYCSSSSLADDLGVSEAACRDPYAWCSSKGVSSSACLETFFNDELNSSSLPVRNYMIDSNTTIDGRGAQATFVFNGFKIGADSSGASTHVSENVIITNNKFIGVGHTEDHSLDPDMIRSTGESHDIWIHKNTFDTTGDSAFDVKVGAYNITMSFNKLVDVKRAALHGSSDSRTINEQIRTTMHNNNFVTTDAFFDTAGNTARRVPLIRRGTSHQFNNLFMNYRKDILSIRKGASVVHEDNIFLINGVHQEKSDVNDAIDERAEELMRDYSDGNFLASGTPLYFSDSECQLDASTYRDLSAAAGTVTDVYADYNADTMDAIASYGLSAGQDLADYVAATAGVDGNLPYNSPLAASISAVVAAHNSGCQ
ncbi:Pectate lyase [Alteromonadaceae bacterium Bs31]|nr:Pectate lyase [Alteromonadaceae bacterium Bs31]